MTTPFQITKELADRNWMGECPFCTTSVPGHDTNCLQRRAQEAIAIVENAPEGEISKAAPGGRYSRDWELVSADTFRLRVPSGWLVTSTDDGAVGLCFVPDPDKQWLLEDAP